VLSQTFRAIVHSRMRVGMDRYRHEFKNADVLLFEPAQNDADMFFANVFSYGERSRLCEHAYQCTRADLWRRRHALIPALRRHGLDLNLTVLKDHRRTLIENKRGEPRVPVAATTRALGDALDDLQQWLLPRVPA
jgi:hypothetical protein